MPITPFHFGPGAAVQALFPQRVSFIAFALSNVLLDFEPAYYMLNGQFPLHRFFHSFFGSTFIIPVVVLIFAVMRKLQQRVAWFPDLYNWSGLSITQVSLGATIGVYSHIVLDGIMHSDIQPFAPFGSMNPFLHLLPLNILHWLCIVAALLAFCVTMYRSRQPVHSSNEDDDAK
ncbi:metal-dependent hydrolase [Undibacterium sp. Di24W]|uniref:metal-dependent hydrolase n=1 Tax=Undibacterium sp. Di24W TaxID=3413033 RepID=UPI003BF030C4